MKQFALLLICCLPFVSNAQRKLSEKLHSTVARLAVHRPSFDADLNFEYKKHKKVKRKHHHGLFACNNPKRHRKVKSKSNVRMALHLSFNNDKNNNKVAKR